jgi:hypothetical protein
MVALLCFLLTLLASPFKSKPRLEAENAVLRPSADHIAAEGGRSRASHERGSLVPSSGASMVSIGAEDHHDHPA